ncbi:MAG: ATP-binding protein [Micavibrio sp.]|nr:ATP-binding protein [Micavibrio sp.]
MPTERLEKQLLAVKTANLSHEAMQVSLKDSLGYIQSILDTIRTPVLILDSELRVRTASRAFYQTFSVLPDSAEGRFLFDLENGAWNILSLRTKLLEVLPKESSFDDFEIEHYFPTLGQRSMLLNARKLWSEVTHTSLILLVIEDVTAKRIIEQELLRSNEDLQRFAYVAAHDLRTPIGAALGLCQILSSRIKDRLSETENRLLDAAIKSMRDQNELLDGILSYSVANAQKKSPQELKLEEPLSLALSNLRADVEATHAIVRYGAMPTIQGDRIQYALLFQNIIGNAIKYRRPDVAPLVTVSAKVVNGQVEIIIADNGRGFSAEDAEKIFAPFMRLEGAGANGSGIGLATCRRIVASMNGQISAQGIEGEGAVFTLSIPIENL